jgi:uncharacterized membrane protein
MLIRLRTKIRTYLVTGLLTILPIVATIFIINFCIDSFDKLFGSPFRDFVERYGFPGIKIVVFAVEFGIAIVLITLVGLFVTNFIGRTILGWTEGLLARVPIISRIYSAIKQLIQTLFLRKQDTFTSVVLVEYPRKGIHSIGLVMSETKGEIKKISKEELLNVFIPTTPNPTSGFLLVVPKKETIPLDMSVEDGIKLIVSGGIIIPHKEKNG